MTYVTYGRWRIVVPLYGRDVQLERTAPATEKFIVYIYERCEVIWTPAAPP